MPALIIDPQLQASVIRQFNLRGELAPFNLTENVVPIFDIGRLLTQTLDPTVVTTLAGNQGVRIGVAGNTNYLQVGPPLLGTADVDNARTVVNPGAGVLIVDAGAASTGNRWVQGTINSDGAISDFDLEWRNAANSATLATYTMFCGTGQPSVPFGPFVFAFVGTQRVRIIAGAGVTGNVNGSIITAGISDSVAN